LAKEQKRLREKPVFREKIKLINYVGKKVERFELHGKPTLGQGCQMVYFQTIKNNLDIFCMVLECKMLVNFETIWNILRPYGMYILWPFDIVCVRLV
jgi:hypothetical protein